MTGISMSAFLDELEKISALKIPSMSPRVKLPSINGLRSPTTARLSTPAVPTARTTLNTQTSSPAVTNVKNQMPTRLNVMPSGPTSWSPGSAHIQPPPTIR